MKNAILLMLTLPACAEQRPSITDIDRQLVTSRYLSCLQRHAVASDDGKSDARTIAYAVRGSCQTKMDEVVAVFGRDMTNDAKFMFRARLVAQELDMATQATLAARNGRLIN